MADFVLKSYNADLANDEERDHYGFRRSKRQSAQSKPRWQDQLSSDDDDREQESSGYQSGSDEEQERDSDAQSASDGDSDDYELMRDSSNKRSPKKGARGRNASKRVKSDDDKLRTVARVTTLAIDDEEGKNAEADMARANLAKVDTGILARIKKALTLAAHTGTGEQEARQAMRMAGKLMQTHNISQADVMATETEEQKVKRAGASVVTIRSTTGASVVMAAWTSTLSGAMEEFFNVKCYSTTFGDRSRITWTFYGLAEGTVAAARAMEWCHNLILTWSAKNKAAKGRNVKNLYCNGVADGLLALAHAERRAEERAAARAERERLRKAVEDEAAQRAAEIARLKDPEPVVKDEPASASVSRKAKVEDVEDPPLKKADRDRPGHSDYTSESDDDDEYGLAFGRGLDALEDPHADFDDADEVDESMDLDAALRTAEDKAKIRIKIEPERDVKPSLPSPTTAPPKIKPEPTDDAAPAAWGSTMQLTRFRSDAAAIADAFLEEQLAREAAPGEKPQKLKMGRARAPLVWKDENGRAAYHKGKEDAKNIEVRRKRIEGAK